MSRAASAHGLTCSCLANQRRGALSCTPDGSAAEVIPVGPSGLAHLPKPNGPGQQVCHHARERSGPRALVTALAASVPLETAVSSPASEK